MALITAAEVIDRGRFTPGEYEWAERDNPSSLDSRVAVWIGQASRYIKQAVGASTYASTNADISGCLKDAELAYCVHIGLRQRLMMLSSRPEEAPPDVYIDLSALRDEIGALTDEMDVLLAPYRLDHTRQPGLAFSFVATTIFESEETPYTHNAATLANLTTQRDQTDYSGREPNPVGAD